jgi:formate hydrogenlyase subunit 6/NADH:ubiquinone oxidoreductase subunit I
MFLLKEKDLKELLSIWSREAQVYAPQIEEGQVMLLPYEESCFTMDYINFAFPVKEYMFKQKEILFNWENKNGSISVEVPRNLNKGRKIFFGVRSCDAYGIKYMDKFFLEGYKDEFYEKHRSDSIVVAVNCTEAGENCFCSSMGTGPFASTGHDLLFTPLNDGYLVEAGTDEGEKLIESSGQLFTKAEESFLMEKETVLKEALETFEAKIHAENVSKVLEDNFNNPIWEKLSKACITCTGCTTLCPTCTCFNLVEESTGSCSGCRVRYWDSCQSDSFTRNAKNHNPRSSVARVRYRIYDKFKYIEDKFEMKGCTGCGRCINVCPASINVVEIINELADSNLSDNVRGGE